MASTCPPMPACPDTPCVLWQGSRNALGYGTVQRGGFHLAHRWAYARAYGAIPDNHEIDHLCRVRACVNPEHLEAVTHAEHMARGAKAQKTHCKHGHPYDEHNTYFRKQGGRECRTCKRKLWKAHYDRKIALGHAILGYLEAERAA